MPVSVKHYCRNAIKFALIVYLTPFKLPPPSSKTSVPLLKDFRPLLKDLRPSSKTSAPLLCPFWANSVPLKIAYSPPGLGRDWS